MKNFWKDSEAAGIKNDLDMRVYTSRLLGKDTNLVMHGGGNTSVKSTVNGEEILYAKGSGWDLETIEPAGFAPVKMSALMAMAKLDSMSDTDMVAQQREAMIDASAPNPSVEAILHAVIPFKFVDHTHADALVTLSNTPKGDDLLRQLYGKRVIYVPYVMPGFILAKAVYEQTKNLDWSKIEGMVLEHHGLFTFADTGKAAYDKMIELAGLAEDYLRKNSVIPKLEDDELGTSEDYLYELFEQVAELKYPDDPGAIMGALNDSNISQVFAAQEEAVIQQISVLTPDHIIRTKQRPLILSGRLEFIEEELAAYVKQYKAYFKKHATGETCLNVAPNYAVIKDVGSVAFGQSEKEVQIIQDLNDHTFEAVLRAQAFGGYKPLKDAELFEMEYWELEQAKLKKG